MLTTTTFGVMISLSLVPVGFAFTLGRLGFLTIFMKSFLGVDLYGNGFTLYSKLAIEIVYLYFQFPLMVLIIAPAIDGLRREWLEAAENLGANSFQYWRYVALPILTPAVLGTMVLLFGNAFGAFATAQALTGGQPRPAAGQGRANSQQ